ncbi:uncharacterized protein METZ01_LOCUS515595, partial [marine metagenome]
NRAINIHFWSNKNVYWDIGSNNSVDRINKAAADNEYKGSWSHWAFTKNKTTGIQKTYLNGGTWQSATGRTKAMATPGSVSKFKIGANRDGNNRWHGMMDDLRFYDKALTDVEVGAIYNYGAGDQGAPGVSSANQVGANVSAPYSFTVTAVVPNPAFPPTFAATGLPAGLDIHQTTGVISGTATVAAETTSTISVTNGYGTTDSLLVFTFYDLPYNVAADPADDIGLYG